MANVAAERNAHRGRLRLLWNDDDNDNHNSTATMPTEEERKEAELVLKAPVGWKKERHSSYPTTDLNVVDDLEKGDRNYLKGLLDARLSPLLERVFGVSRDSIRAYDMFIVRYDGEGQQSLRKHTDSSHISFNILLNDDFIGGGTRYHNRADDTSTDVTPNAGQILLHSARIHHEGLPTISGTRYIFVGFMSIDRKNPLTGEPSSLSWRSSWLSFPWLTVTIAEALSKTDGSSKSSSSSPSQAGEARGGSASSTTLFSNNTYWNDFLVKLFHLLQVIADLASSHDVTVLVNETDHDAYIDALNVGYDERGKDLGKSAWFDGQLIEPGFNGLSGHG